MSGNCGAPRDGEVTASEWSGEENPTAPAKPSVPDALILEGPRHTVKRHKSAFYIANSALPAAVPGRRDRLLGRGVGPPLPPPAAPRRPRPRARPPASPTRFYCLSQHLSYTFCNLYMRNAAGWALRRGPC